MDDPDGFGSHFAQRFGDRHQPLRRIDAEQLAFRTSRIGKRAEQVEYRPCAELDPARTDMAHRRVVHRGEHEAYPCLANAAGDQVRADLEIDAERRQRVGGARLGTQRPVSVLGDGNPGTCRDDRGEGGDVVGTGAIAAGADDIDRIGRSLDPQHLGAHGRDGAGHFGNRFAPDPERHQEAADLRRGRFAGHENSEGVMRLFAGKRFAGGDLGEERLQVGHFTASASITGLWLQTVRGRPG